MAESACPALPARPLIERGVDELCPLTGPGTIASNGREWGGSGPAAFSSKAERPLLARARRWAAEIGWKAGTGLVSGSMLTKLSMMMIETIASAATCLGEPRQLAASVAEARGDAAVLAATRACEHLKKDEKHAAAPPVGVSAYEACLGERANLTRPANSQLCALAKSVLSPAGICIIGE